MCGGRLVVLWEATRAVRVPESGCPTALGRVIEALAEAGERLAVSALLEWPRQRPSHCWATPARD